MPATKVNDEVTYAYPENLAIEMENSGHWWGNQGWNII
jgi:hypothetical protein